MSKFSCPVVRILSVEDHPNADRLSVVKLSGLGYICISGKLDDGSHRYNPGDWVVYIPSAAILPEWLLKKMEFWNYETEHGMLAGADGNRVKPLKLRGIFSEGVLYPVDYNDALSRIAGGSVIETSVDYPDSVLHRVEIGDDASDILGITKYVPPIPVHMAGEVANMFGHTIRYDFDRLESNPDMFSPHDVVIATEKLHGTFVAMIYEPGLNHSEMFGESGDIIVHSKGLGGQGVAFKNNSNNDKNLYVSVLKKLLDRGLEDRFKKLAQTIPGRRYAILGEIYGKGVQDLHYGENAPSFRAFDLMVDDTFIPCNQTGFGNAMDGFLDMVPQMYHGPFDLTVLERLRDGKTNLGGGNIREGIVIRCANEIRHEIHGRRILKMISPDYLLRKSKDASEFT